MRESRLWLLVVCAVAAVEAWLTRAQLNPDGAAYLDLADALRNGAWGAFVQEYWSPLAPAWLALVRAGASAAGADQLLAVHIGNAVVVSVAAWLTHRLVSALAPADTPEARGAHRLWVRSAWATCIVCALIFTRIDSVTPDALFLCVMVAVAHELLVHRGVRAARLGALLGLAFLVRTSAWPWLIVTIVALAAPWSAVSRRQVLHLAGAAVGVASLWLVPMSIDAGRPTPGSTGRLNACWFLRECDSRSPDTHERGHHSYAELTTADGATIVYATFRAPGWTYEPWSDPTAWAKGVERQHEEPLTVARYAAIVMRNVREAVRYVGGYLYLAVLVPVVLWRVLGGRTTPGALWRDAAVVPAVLGAIGMAQFVAVQVQPRLLTPFAFLHVVAMLVLLLRSAPSRAAEAGAGATPATGRKRGARGSGSRGSGVVAGRKNAGVEALLSWIAPAVALSLVGYSLYGEVVLGRATATSRDELRSMSVEASRGFVRRTVVVVGEAFPLVGHAKALDARIVAQVLPRSAERLAAYPPRERLRLIQALAGGAADVAWEWRADGRIQITPLH